MRKQIEGGGIIISGQNINEINTTNPEDIEAINVLVKEIVKAIRGNVVNCDRTFKTVIKKVTPKGYIILDESGSERCVKCCIPNVSLRVGQMVFAKIPCNQIKWIHICGGCRKIIKLDDRAAPLLYIMKKFGCNPFVLGIVADFWHTLIKLLSFLPFMLFLLPGKDDSQYVHSGSLHAVC